MTDCNNIFDEKYKDEQIQKHLEINQFIQQKIQQRRGVKSQTNLVKFLKINQKTDQSKNNDLLSISQRGQQQDNLSQQRDQQSETNRTNYSQIKIIPVQNEYQNLESDIDKSSNQQENNNSECSTKYQLQSAKIRKKEKTQSTIIDSEQSVRYNDNNNLKNEDDKSQSIFNQSQNINQKDNLKEQNSQQNQQQVNTLFTQQSQVQQDHINQQLKAKLRRQFASATVIKKKLNIQYDKQSPSPLSKRIFSKLSVNQILQSQQRDQSPAYVINTKSKQNNQKETIEDQQIRQKLMQYIQDIIQCYQFEQQKSQIVKSLNTLTIVSEKYNIKNKQTGLSDLQKILQEIKERIENQQFNYSDENLKNLIDFIITSITQVKNPALLYQATKLCSKVACINKEYQQAVVLYQACKTSCEQKQNLKYRLRCYKQIAKCFLLMGLQAKAIKYILKFLRSAWYLNDSDMELKAYDLIGKYYFYEGDLEKAQQFHNKLNSGQCENKDSFVRKIAIEKVENIFNQDYILQYQKQNKYKNSIYKNENHNNNNDDGNLSLSHDQEDQELAILGYDLYMENKFYIPQNVWGLTNEQQKQKNENRHSKVFQNKSNLNESFHKYSANRNIRILSIQEQEEQKNLEWSKTDVVHKILKKIANSKKYPFKIQNQRVLTHLNFSRELGSQYDTDQQMNELLGIQNKDIFRLIYSRKINLQIKKLFDRFKLICEQAIIQLQLYKAKKTNVYFRRQGGLLKNKIDAKSLNQL